MKQKEQTKKYDIFYKNTSFKGNSASVESKLKYAGELFSAAIEKAIDHRSSLDGMAKMEKDQRKEEYMRAADMAREHRKAYDELMEKCRTQYIKAIEAFKAVNSHGSNVRERIEKLFVFIEEKIPKVVMKDINLREYLNPLERGHAWEMKAYQYGKQNGEQMMNSWEMNRKYELMKKLAKESFIEHVQCIGAVDMGAISRIVDRDVSENYRKVVKEHFQIESRDRSHETENNQMTIGFNMEMD